MMLAGWKHQTLKRSYYAQFIGKEDERNEDVEKTENENDTKNQFSFIEKKKKEGNDLKGGLGTLNFISSMGLNVPPELFGNDMKNVKGSVNLPMFKNIFTK